jgi:thioredoxin-like negative regulator of GroEL
MSQIPSCGIVKFTAKWCGPCQSDELKNTLSVLKDKYKLPVEEIDVDEHANIAESFEISSIPAFVFFNDGKECDRCIGGDAQNLEAGFEKIKKLSRSN